MSVIFIYPVNKFDFNEFKYIFVPDIVPIEDLIVYSHNHSLNTTPLIDLI